MRRIQLFGVMVLTGLGAATTGCSVTSGAITGGKMLMNMGKESNYLRVLLDQQEGKQNALKKAWSGPSGTRFVIEEPVSTSPTFSYRMKDPDKFGRVTLVSFQLHREFDGDFSHQAEYVVTSRDTSPETQLKPDTDYQVSNLQANFKIYDRQGNVVPKIELLPNTKYRIALTVVADRSETILVEFKTK